MSNLVRDLLRTSRAPQAISLPAGRGQVYETRAALLSRAPAGAFGSATVYPTSSLPEFTPNNEPRIVTETYLRNLYVYRCIDQIASDLSAIPFRAVRDPAAPGEYSTTTPLAHIFGPPPGGPNPIWSSRALWKWIIAEWLVLGKFALLYDDPYRPTTLWPLMAQRLHPIPVDPNVPSTHYFQSYKYDILPRPRVYSRDEVAYCWQHSLEDHRRPQSVMQAADLQASTLQMLETFEYNYYRNNGVPGTIVVTEKFEDPNQREAFRRQYQDTFSGPSNAGKSQPLSAPVLTPAGWKRMGDLQIGDEVVDPEGAPSTVTHLFPQGVLPVYRLTFDDGSIAEASADHLWEVIVRKRPGNSRSVPRPPAISVRETWTTDQLRTCIASGKSVPRLIKPSGLAQTDFAESTLPIDPYLLGMLIGDGSFVGTTPSYCTADPELKDACADLLPAGVQMVYKPSVSSGNADNFYLSAGVKGRTNPLTAALRELGLWGHSSYTKFVPNSYKWASAKTRLAVLQGLMDTDGNWARGRNQFSSSSRQLRDDVVWLARSLGIVVSTSERTDVQGFGGEGVTNAPAYRAYLVETEDVRHFRLTRKLRPVGTGEKGKYRKPVSIEYVHDEACQCIKVSAPSSLYVTNDFVPTHNTLFLEARPDTNADGSTSAKATEKVSVQRVATTQKEALTDSKARALKDDICNAFGVPRSRLGDASGRSFDNAGQEDENYYRSTIRPLGLTLQDEISTHIAPRFSKLYVGAFEFGVVPVLGKQLPYGWTSQTVISLRQNGDLDRDEIRHLLGFPAWDAVSHPKEPTPPALPAPNTGQPAAPNVPALSQKAIGPGRPPTRDSLPEVLETMLRLQVARVIQEQQRSAATRASGKRGHQTAPLIDRAYWITRATEELTPVTSAIAQYTETPNLANSLATRITDDTLAELEARTLSSLTSHETRATDLIEEFRPHFTTLTLDQFLAELVGG